MEQGIPATSMFVGALSVVAAAAIGIIAIAMNRDTDESSKRPNFVLFIVLVMTMPVGGLALWVFTSVGEGVIRNVAKFWLDMAVWVSWVTAVGLAAISWISRRNIPRRRGVL